MAITASTTIHSTTDVHRSTYIISAISDKQ